MTTANTQPKQLEQQNNRLKEATAKVYYTESVGIIYIRRQSITDVELTIKFSQKSSLSHCNCLQQTIWFMGCGSQTFHFSKLSKPIIIPSELWPSNLLNLQGCDMQSECSFISSLMANSRCCSEKLVLSRSPTYWSSLHLMCMKYQSQGRIAK